jgi:hypothetical protein
MIPMLEPKNWDEMLVQTGSSPDLLDAARREFDNAAKNPLTNGEAIPTYEANGRVFTGYCGAAHQRRVLKEVA